MVNNSHSWFYPALILTVVIHMLAISPLATWLSRSLIPTLTDTSIEIDLTEIKARTEQKTIIPQKPPPTEPEKRIEPDPIPEVKPEKKPEPLPLEKPDLSDQSEKILNPEKKKILNPELAEDIIVKPGDKDSGQRLTKPVPAQPAPDKKEPVVEKPPEKMAESRPPAPTSQPQKQTSAPAKAIETKPPPIPEKKAEPEVKPEEAEEEIVSPLFVRKPQKEDSPSVATEEEVEPALPEEIVRTFREGAPEKTEEETLEFSMNSYKWTFERYMENWAYDLQRWWKPPLDYAMGNIPDGGDMWIQVELAKSGKLLGYRIVKSNITAEMELMVIQALVGSLARPAIPASFPEASLIINWHFIYPPLRPKIDLRKKSRG